MLKRRERYGKVHLLVGAKTPSGLLYKSEYGRWREDVELLLTVDRPEEAWNGHVGVITELLDKVDVDPEGAVGMMCGPEVMMFFTVKKLLEMGFREGRVFLSMERHMKCAVGTCGHCQFGYTSVCKDGPIFPYSKIKPIFGIKEL